MSADERFKELLTEKLFEDLHTYDPECFSKVSLATNLPFGTGDHIQRKCSEVKL